MISSQVGMWVCVVIRDISKVCGGQTLLIGRADIRPKMSLHIHNLSSIIYKYTIKTDGTFSAFIISKEAKQPFLPLLTHLDIFGRLRWPKHFWQTFLLFLLLESPGSVNILLFNKR